MFTDKNNYRSSFHKSDRYVFGDNLKLRKAPEPTDIIWKNYGID